jgi:hypothetical protein
LGHRKGYSHGRQLKERVEYFEARLGTAETQNDIDKGNLQKANTRIEELETENQSLKNQVEDLTNPQLTDTGKQILYTLAQELNTPISKGELCEILSSDPLTIDYTVDELERGHMWLQNSTFHAQLNGYRLLHPGKKYVMDHPSDSA